MNLSMPLCFQSQTYYLWVCLLLGRRAGWRLEFAVSALFFSWLVLSDSANFLDSDRMSKNTCFFVLFPIDIHKAFQNSVWIWYKYLAWCQVLVSNSSPELSGGDDNSDAIGAEPKWLWCVVTESTVPGSPEVGLDHELFYAICSRAAAAFLGNAA